MHGDPESPAGVRIVWVDFFVSGIISIRRSNPDDLPAASLTRVDSSSR
jgi:hypothetical protein